MKRLKKDIEMKKELLKDNGKIRNCTSNVYKMNYFELAIYDIKYLLPYELRDGAIEFLKQLFYCFSFILILLLLPIFIFLRVHNRKKRAKKEMFEFKKPDLCPFRKITERFNPGMIEYFVECVGETCSAWSEHDNVCSLCSDKRVFNIEARVDTRYKL